MSQKECNLKTMKKLLTILVFIAFACTSSVQKNDNEVSANITLDQMLMEKSIYDFKLNDIDGNEVDFVLPEVDAPFAIEAKFDEAQIKPNKYQKFKEAYPEIDFKFSWYNSFDEGFIRRI